MQLGGVGRRLGALGEIWERFSFFSAGAACAVLCVSCSRVEWSPVCGCAAVALEPPRKPKSLAECQGDHCAMRVILLACSASWIFLYFTFSSCAGWLGGVGNGGALPCLVLLCLALPCLALVAPCLVLLCLIRKLYFLCSLHCLALSKKFFQQQKQR